MHEVVPEGAFITFEHELKIILSLLSESRHTRRIRINGEEEGVGSEEIMLDIHDSVNYFVYPYARV